MTPSGGLHVVAVPGVPEVRAGDELAGVVLAALDGAGLALEDGDVLAVASKVVAKAEGRYAPEGTGRDDAVLAESVRVVAERSTPRGPARIVESRSGPVLAAAGVDVSNVPGGRVLLLPAEPDASARRLRASVVEATGRRVGVVVTDTLGRPWREGQVDACVGAAGVRVVDDLRGSVDAVGQRLDVTVRALADGLAAAADLVRGKADGLPLVLLRGLDVVTDDDGPGAAALRRAASADWFRLGAVEAVRTALGAPPGTPGVPLVPVVDDGERSRWVRAVAVAMATEEGTPSVEVGEDGVTVEGLDAVRLGALAQRVMTARGAEQPTAQLRLEVVREEPLVLRVVSSPPEP